MLANQSFIVTLGLLVGWSTVQAAPRHRPPARPVHDAVEEHDDDEAAAPKTVAYEPDEPDDRVVDAVDEQAPAPATGRRAPRGWQLEIGPYVWASAVHADVSFGPLATGVDLGFLTLARHSRYGIEALAELRHGRFAISGDVMYGVADVAGATTIASVMTSLTATASNLLLEGTASYRVLGDDDSPVSLEARAGVRYQRTVVSGEIGIASFMLQTPELVDDGSDVVAGARAVIRPARWLLLSGAADLGVVGVSDRTWSASIDAGVRVSTHLMVSAGYRTLTMARAYVSIELSGPRVAVQLMF